MRYQFTSTKAARVLFCMVLVLAVIRPVRLTASPLLLQDGAAAQSVDPDKPASELNHHIAGILLITIGLSVIGSGYHRSLAWLRWLPPILFLAAGLFLAAWSDSEIWPRGNLAWSWLLHHDAEAFQHKLYALLLIVLGVVEAIQANPKLRRPWLSLVFPLLGVIGAASLFFHHHSGDVVAGVIAQAAPASCIDQCRPPVVYQPVNVHVSGPFPASANFGRPGVAGIASAQHHEHHDHHDHHLMGPAAKIQTEHAWFAVVGFLVVLLKFLYDTARPPARLLQFFWGNSVILLGILLLLYTE